MEYRLIVYETVRSWYEVTSCPFDVIYGCNDGRHTMQNTKRLQRDGGKEQKKKVEQFARSDTMD